MSISWKPWASLGAPSPADAHHQVTAAGGSSIIEFAAAAPRRPKTCPNATRKRARFAAIHQLISSFRVRAGDPARARITSISGTPATRRRRVGGNRVFFMKASPLRFRQALAAHGRTRRRGPLRCPIARHGMPPTLLHRTLIFPLGRAGPRPEASRNAHAFRSHSPGVDDPKEASRRASLNTRAPATGPVARGEAPKGGASSASAGFGRGRVHARKAPKGARPCSSPWAQPLE